MTYVTAIVPTDRKKADWRDTIKTLEDYSAVLKTGCAWVWFPDLPSESEFKEYLDNKEKE